MHGGCHCRAVRYRNEGEPIASALCHCTDCRKQASAPVVGWAMLPEASITVVKGPTKTYSSSEHGRRQFWLEPDFSIEMPK